MKKKETLEQKFEILLGHISELNNADEIEEVRSILEDILASVDSSNEEAVKILNDLKGRLDKAFSMLGSVEDDITDNLYNLVLYNTENEGS